MEYATSEKDEVTTTFLPISARLDQLHAAVKAALDKTSGLTYYPHLDMPMPEKAELAQPSVLAMVDELNDLMSDLNQRLARVNEVVGGRL